MYFSLGTNLLLTTVTGANNRKATIDLAWALPCPQIHTSVLKFLSGKVRVDGHD